jgi:RHS repeat-associated protein
VWLHSRAATAAREASRTEYRNLSSQAAASVVVRRFGKALTDASATPAANPAVAGHVVRYVNPHEAIIRTAKGKRLAISSVPLVSSQGGHGSVPVDLRLHTVAGGFAPANPLQPLVIGSHLTDGVSVGGGGLRFTLQGADVFGQLLNGAGVFFANVAADTDAEAAPTSNGVELYALLRSPRSPEHLRYTVTLPPGESLKSMPGGRATVMRDGRVIGDVLPPVASDAQGSAVPVKLTVVGDSLLLDVSHRAGRFAYPILVDPTYTVSTSSAVGSWQEHTPVAWWNPLGSSGPNSIVAQPGTYNVGGMDSLYWQWSPPISSNGNGANWTIYGVDLENNDTTGTIAYVGFTVGCEQETETAGQSVIAQQQTFNDWCQLNPGTPIFKSSIMYRSGNAAGGGIAAFSSFLVTTTIPCSSNCPLDGGPITPDEGYGANNPSESTNQCQWGPYPVNCATGNFWHSFIDTSVPDRGLPLALTRTYNSLDASTPSPFGYGWSSSYSMRLTFPSNGDVVVHQEDGATATFLPKGGGQFWAAPRVIATLVKNNDGTYTFTRRARDQFVFSSTGRLSSISDLNGDTNNLSYNGSGQLTSVSDAQGQLTFSYGSNGDVSSVTDPGGRVVSYSYDGSGNLTQVTDPASGTTSFSYDGSHRVTEMTDPRGGTVSNTYNSGGQVVSQTDPMSHTTTFGYSSNTTTITDPNGNVTTETYSNGELASITRGSGTSSAATWSYLYDPASAEVIQATDPNGKVTQYAYDGSGNLLQKVDPLNHKTTYTYNSLDEPTSVSDPSGETTTITYDSDGNETSVSRPLTQTGQNQTTTFTYGDSNHPGDVTAVTDPNAKTTDYGYDSHGNVTSVTDPLGNETTYGYDSLGRVTSMVSPRGNVSGADPASFTTTYGYDPDSRLTSEIGPLGQTQTWTYDGDGNLTGHTDADNHTTSYSYNADNKLTTVTRPGGSTLQTGYDGDGMITSRTDGAGHTTSYAYDPLERLSSVTDPLSRKTSYAHDGAGNLTGVTDPQARTTTYAYDADNELTSISYSDGTTANVTYGYDADGRRTSMSDGTGNSSYGYDSLGRLTSTTDGAGHQIAYGYDLRNNATSITYPNGKVVTRSFDGDGRLTSVADWLSNTTAFSYDPDSNLTATTFPSGTSNIDSYSYDDADQLSSINMNQSSSTLASLSYSRDPAGLITSESQTGLPGPASTSYGYTQLNQLASAGSSAYSYDQAENVTQLDGTSGYSYDQANELTSSPTGSYSYDQLGERTATTPNSGPATNYSYDQAGRLTSISGATTASYTYNGDGLRTSQTAGGTASTYTWDQTSSLPLLLSDGQDSYIYGPGDTPIEQIDSNGNATYIHHDQLGSTRLLTDSSGATTGTFTYSPYGALQASSGNATTPFGYAGQYTDPATGLQYDRARDYDPTTGQFITRDPLQAITQAPYTYANDNPLSETDPSGRFAGAAAGCAIGESVDPFGGCVPGAVAGTVASGIVAAGAAIFSLFSDDSNSGDSTDQTASNADSGAIECTPSDQPFLNPLSTEDASTAAPDLANLSPKIERDLIKRGWTPQEIQEAYDNGEQIPAVNKANGAAATRYVNPTTGKSVVIENDTGQVIHVGGSGFKYGPGSGDLP